MDVYEQYSTPPPPLECLRIDDLLDFSNDDLFSSSSTSTAALHHHLPPPPPAFSCESRPSIYYNCHSSSASFNLAAAPSTDFTDNLSVPSDDVAELEWLSQFVDDSFAEFPAHPLSGANNLSVDTSLSGRARSKRSRGKVTDTASWILAPTAEFESPAAAGKPRTKKETRAAPSPTEEGGVRRCTHCASEKTPQWRTGPLGPKTLCNACGVRYKSGRLVPEYRPAASPTFVLTQHSNSHRKVMELRRKKEMLRQNQRPQEVLSDDHQQHSIYHHQDFEVC